MEPSSGAATASEKGEVTTQGDESEDLEVLKEGTSIMKPPAREPATGEALVETTVVESVSLLKLH